ncbi:MAG: methylated-DNA-[protein]-cysteine S-methyltransferase [Solirubrobacteraceae bacterium]|nr:methylated-DNA-[protein]-cysteine S-methyltransferase [Solirubrobacteraceae bacterium]
MWTIYDSPVGPLTLFAGEHGLRSLWFPGGEPPTGTPDPAALAPVTTQLDEYFAGERRTFDLELDLRGSEFQLEVWTALREIPFGETIAYGELAARVGRAGHEHVRAVAGCVGRTPVPIIVPCHRVIGADGSLTGYGGGLDRKRALLDHEGAFAQLSLI